MLFFFLFVLHCIALRCLVLLEQLSYRLNVLAFHLLPRHLERRDVTCIPDCLMVWMNCALLRDDDNDNNDNDSENVEPA